MNDFWNYQILNNTIKDWAISFSIIIVSILVLRVLKTVFVKRFKTFSQKTKTSIDDFIVFIIQKTVMPLLYVLAVYFGLQYIEMPAKPAKIVHIAMLLAETFFILKTITSFLRYLFTKTLSGDEQNEKREKQAKGILLIVNILVWILGFLFLVDNLGYDITTLVAGLGIGGIAIALAAQTILGDLFSYLVIFFDKPFEIGDFIIVEDKMGTVEYIGIKTTRLRTLGGEQLVCSNTDLTNSRVHNYKRMEQRRIAFTFGVVYDTPVEKLKQIPVLVKKIIEDIPEIKFDRAHFKDFGDFALNFEVVYYVLTSDFNLYMDKQQHANFMILDAFAKEKIEFAFPTQTVIINNQSSFSDKNSRLAHEIS